MVAWQFLWILSLCIVEDGVTQPSVDREQPTWVTEGEYRFGDAPDRDVFFSWPHVVADPERNRVFAADAANSQVSVWTPQGSLLFVVGGKGEGPGEFVSLGDLFVEADGSFSVQETGRSRFTYFTSGGELIRAVRGPGTTVDYQGVFVELHRPNEDGVYLGVPRSAELEAGPVERQPVLRVGGSGGGEWSEPKPLLWLDRRNRTHVMILPNGDEMYGAQPFGDPDQVRFEPGAAVVMRLNEVPGAVELIEVSTEGDTVWHRRLRFEPRRLTRRMVTEATEATLDRWAEVFPEMPRTRLRQIYEAGLHKPDFVPPVEGPPILASSGEVWLRTTERSDTLRAYYVVRRGDTGGDPRRVLLPERMWLNDATRTHVWGVVQDALERPHVVGRRLVLR